VSPRSSAATLLPPMGRTDTLNADGAPNANGVAELTPRALAAFSNAELRQFASAEARQVAAHQGRLVAVVGELDRRQGWRDEGATSLAQWIVEATGAAPATARALAQLAEHLFDLPRLAAALCAGDASFDQVRTVAQVARPENDARWAELAAGRTVRELAEAAQAAAEPSTARNDDESRRSVRFNEATRTMVAQLAPEVFTEVRAGLEARAGRLGKGTETPVPLDERLADALVEALRVRGGSHGASPHLVVAHVRLSELMNGGAEGDELVAELERGGLISARTLQRLACDATLVIGVDDDEGHTMYEGRQVRDATPTQRREIMRRDRHCRFPGCGHVAFWIPHHLKHWAHGGPTDLDNLCCLCQHHHALMHSKGWVLSGNANEELTFVGPSGRVMTSRPSPLWTRATGPQSSKGRGT
jgi:hypothetical protein